MQPSPYNEYVGTRISLSKAEKWIKKYQQKHPRPGSDPTVKEEPTYATFFGRKFITEFMERWGDECVGLRVYQAIDDTDPATPHHRRVVLIAVDKDGNDLLDKPRDEKEGSADDVAADDGIQCPTACSGTGTLIGQ